MNRTFTTSRTVAWVENSSHTVYELNVPTRYEKSLSARVVWDADTSAYVVNVRSPRHDERERGDFVSPFDAMAFAEGLVVEMLFDIDASPVRSTALLGQARIV